MPPEATWRIVDRISARLKEISVPLHDAFRDNQRFLHLWNDELVPLIPLDVVPLFEAADLRLPPNLAARWAAEQVRLREEEKKAKEAEEREKKREKKKAKDKEKEKPQRALSVSVVLPANVPVWKGVSLRSADRTY